MTDQQVEHSSYKHAANMQPDLADVRKDKWLRQQYSWQDVEHLIQSGQILSLVYDIETTDLNPMFAALTQFSGAIVDVQGRIIDTIKLDIRVPEDVVISPQAAIVTQLSPEQLYSKNRLDPHLAVARILQYFRNPYRVLWDKLDTPEARRIVSSVKDGEEARAYIITSPDGAQQAEIRLHNSGRSLSYRYPDKVDHFCSLLRQAEDSHAALERIAQMLDKPLTELVDAQAGLNTRSLKRYLREYFNLHHHDYLVFLRELEPFLPPELLETMRDTPKEDSNPKPSRTYIDDADASCWIKVPAPAITSGHNIARFDDRVLWSYFHRYMSNDIFVTHIKDYQRARVDTLGLARLVAMLDKTDVNRFVAGKRINYEDGTERESFSLSDLMDANTREANAELGIDEGIRMPDGSKYNRKLAHADASYDVSATIALRAYLRKRAPDIVRLIEQHADMDTFKKFLMSDDGMHRHPLRAFVRNQYPNGAQMHLGVCVGVDEEINEKHQAIMLRTDVPFLLKDYAYPLKEGSKKLDQMSVDELAQLMRTQEKSADGLFEIFNLRKNPPVISAEMAFQKGVGEGVDVDHLEENRRFLLAHPEFCDKVMEAYRKNYKPMPDFRDIRNPQPEEHLFTSLASPKRYVFDHDGSKHHLTEVVHGEWEKALQLNRAIDKTLRPAVKPREIEVEVRLDTLEHFIERLKTVDKTMQKKLGARLDALPIWDASEANIEEESEAAEGYEYEAEPSKFVVLPPPDKPFMPKKWDMVDDPTREGKKMRVPHEVTQEELEWLNSNAVEYLWKLRAELVDAFRDTTTRFTLQDAHGHDIPWKTLNAMEESEVTSRIDSGEYHVACEQYDHSGWNAQLMVRMFRDAGRLKWVKDYWEDRGNEAAVHYWQQWEDFLASHRALRINGAPHEDIDDHRWMSAPKALRDIERMERNMREGDRRAAEHESGWWDIYIDNRMRSQQILEECKNTAMLQQLENPLTDAHKERMGYAPDESGFPIEYVPFEVPQGAQFMRLDVPERMLENPLYHRDVAQNFVLLELSDAQRNALYQADDTTYLELRGAQTGRRFFAAKPRVLDQDFIANTPYFADLYLKAANGYAESGMPTPVSLDTLVPVAFEALYPIPAEVDRSVQAIPVARWEDFMAMRSAHLGYRSELLTGLVVDAKEIQVSTGKARFLGMLPDGATAGLRESGYELRGNITRVQTLSLKEIKERIKRFMDREKAISKLHCDSFDALLAYLESGVLSKHQVKEVLGRVNNGELDKLLSPDAAVITRDDARRYGFNSLEEMRSAITQLFTAQQIHPDNEENLLHLIEFDPIEADMIWHKPNARPMLRLPDMPESPSTPPLPDAPDPSAVMGRPRIERVGVEDVITRGVA